MNDARRRDDEHRRALDKVVIGLVAMGLAVACFAALPLIALADGAPADADVRDALRACDGVAEVALGVALVTAAGAWLFGTVRLGMGAVDLALPRPLALTALVLLLQVAAVGVFVLVRGDLAPEMRKAAPLVIGLAGAAAALPAIALAARRWPGLARPRLVAAALAVGALALVPFGLVVVRAAALPLGVVAAASGLTLATAPWALIGLGRATRAVPPPRAER